MQAYLKPHFLISSIGFVVFVYALYILQRDISGAYVSFQNLFNNSKIYPILFTALLIIAPFCVLVLSGLAFFKKTGLYSLPLAIYGWFVLGGYIISAFMVLFLCWQFWEARRVST